MEYCKMKKPSIEGIIFDCLIGKVTEPVQSEYQENPFSLAAMVVPALLVFHQVQSILPPVDLQNHFAHV